MHRGVAPAWVGYHGRIAAVRRLRGACMDLGLADRVVLLTGASKGIGLACAAAFLAEDASVAMISRSRANLVAQLAVFLGSDRASYVTGAIVPMDGASHPVL